MGPRIALTSRTDNATIPTPANGILVYNLTTLAGTEATALAPGYYFWYSGRWYPSKKGEIINITTNGTLKTYLGYDATGVHSAANFSNGGINFTGLGCKQWTMASGGITTGIVLTREIKVHRPGKRHLMLLKAREDICLLLLPWQNGRGLKPIS
ncbi:hypothetical protein ACFOEQ_08315 [Chryseobacterium arachidis]|uniref:hypothetical protein n=1 Tax=Chryseobacterium arachidis TaxID=1416778 RepID=UPI0036070BFA